MAEIRNGNGAGDLQRVTVTVYTRHTAATSSTPGCPYAGEGPDYKKCGCPKWLYVNDGNRRRFSAKTNSWTRAEEEAVRVRRSYDPAVRELAAMKAVIAAADTPILDAIRLYYADLTARKRGKSTLTNSKAVLGEILPNGRVIGSLMKWLEIYNRGKREEEQIVTLSQMDVRLITLWRGSWKYEDTSARTFWQKARGFWKWCVAQKYITDNPTAGMEGIKVKSGNRCGMFTDQQYKDILTAALRYNPKRLPKDMRYMLAPRVHAFCALMRWSGMALIDAVAFRKSAIDKNGILRYRRIKTGQPAVVPIPRDVLDLLDTVNLEPNVENDDQPFHFTRQAYETAAGTWRRRLDVVFMIAGIDRIETEHGKTIGPHPHMFRDTCAIWYLQHGRSLEDVAKILGHKTTRETEKSYSFWIKEREDAMISRIRDTQQGYSFSQPGCIN